VTRIDGGWRSSYWSEWTRRELPDSFNGFFISDFDGLIINNRTHRFCFVEVKQHANHIQRWQFDLYAQLDSYVRKGLESTHLWTYDGVYFLRFENTGFHDGRCAICDLVSTKERLVTEERLKIFLSLEV